MLRFENKPDGQHDVDLFPDGIISGTRSDNSRREFRSFKVRNFQVEIDKEGQKYFTGYAACYNNPSVVLGGQVKFREVIKPGAFTRAIKDRQDVRHLVNHNPSLLLGRTKAGTTKLVDDQKGLYFRTKIGNRTYEQDLVESLSRGDIDECSFSFLVNGRKGQSWKPDPDDKAMQLRELHDVDLLDISIVTYPAYTGTSAEVDERTMFPDGLPQEIESRMHRREVRENSGLCECSCESCVGGMCAGCTNESCDDLFCFMCPNQMDASAMEGAKKLIEAHVADKSNSGRDFRAVKEAGDVLELVVYGDIGDGWFGGVSAEGIKAKVDANWPCAKIRLRINSFGGSVFEGVTICNYLKSLKIPIEVHVDGLAASAASVIAMAGDQIIMASNTMMMIHNASTCAYGYASDFRKTANVLDKISGSLAQTYVDKTGKTKDAITALMDAETWMDAAECVAEGFATALEEPDEKTERALAMVYESRTLKLYKNLPEKFRTPPAPEVAVVPAVSAGAGLGGNRAITEGIVHDAPIDIDIDVARKEQEERDKLRLRIRLAAKL